MRDFLLPTEIHPYSNIESPTDKANIPFVPLTLHPLKLDAEMHRSSQSCFIAFLAGDAVADVIEDYRNNLTSSVPGSEYLHALKDPANKNLLGVMFGCSVIRWSKLKEFSVCAVVFQQLGSRYRHIYQCGKDFTPNL